MSLFRPVLPTLCVVLFAAYTSLATDFSADNLTTALWLFDEQEYPNPLQPPRIDEWYFNRTLTDAGPNRYDLSFFEGANIVKGRFGNALDISPSRVSSGRGLPTQFSSTARIPGVFHPGNPDTEQGTWINLFSYTSYPEYLRETLHADEWTIEFWIKLRSLPTSQVILLDSGQGSDTLIRMSLIPDHSSFVFATDRWRSSCGTILSTLAKGDWVHVSFIKQEGNELVHHYLDGKPVSTGVIETVSKEDQAPPVIPGLATCFFSDGGFAKMAKVEILTSLGSDWYQGRGKEWSARLVGLLQSPHTGDVEFATQAETGIHLEVDNQPVLYGWFGHAGKYRRSPRAFKVHLQEGEWVPFRLDLHVDQDDPFPSPLRLFWSWEGQPSIPIPDEAFGHTTLDLEKAQSENGIQTLADLTRFRFNLVLGSTIDGLDAMDGCLDEFRISRAARYSGPFDPESHSRNCGGVSPVSSVATGPPLLFSGEPPPPSYPMGDNPHLFIDDALIDQMEGLDFYVNTPKNPEMVDVNCKGDICVFENDGRIHMFAPSGYENQTGEIRLYTSDDGLHFHAPELGLVEWEGKTRNNIILSDVCSWGRAAPDPNPNTPPDARFKFSAFVPGRGTHFFYSPDGIHWRRNETILTQVVSGGGSEWYYDDQVGVYRYLLKWDHSPTGRAAVEIETSDPLKPWPHARVESTTATGLLTPYGEMPVRFAPNENGQVYRTRAMKYPWAPDTYLAFVWRFERSINFRQTELATSRDGRNWKCYGQQWYLPAGGSYDNLEIVEALSMDGLIRRNDEIWQYADYQSSKHGEPGESRKVRLRQRLHGFVSLHPIRERGFFITYPITFEGNTLTLNVRARGAVCVAILDCDGNPIEGYEWSDCDPIRMDALAVPVTWRQVSDLSAFKGKTVRLNIELLDSDLYSLCFTKR